MPDYDFDKTERLLQRLEGNKYSPPGTPRKTEPSGTSEEGDDPGFLTSVARGAGKEGASLLTGAGSLANKAIGLVNPRMRDVLSERAGRSPALQRMQEYGQQPYANIAEGIGGIGTDIGAGAAIPMGWLGRAVSAVAGRVLPRIARLTPMMAEAAPKAATEAAAPAAAAAEAEPVFAGGGRGFRSSSEGAAPKAAEAEQTFAGSQPPRDPRYASRFKPVFVGEGQGFRAEPKRAYTRKAIGGAAAKAAEEAPKAAPKAAPAPSSEPYGPPRSRYQVTYDPNPLSPRIGRLAQIAGKGAAGGAIADQDDPLRGAEAGAVGGLAPTAIGRGVVSPVGRYAARHLIPSLGSMGAYLGLHSLGLPGWLAHGLAVPNIRWHSSPIGRRLSRIGDRIVDQFGNLVGVIEGGPSGIAAGRMAPQLLPDEGQ